MDNGCNIWVGDAYKKYRNTSKDSMHDGDLEFLSASHAYEDYYSVEDFIDKIKTDDRFAKKWGELGPVYGKQWRNWHVVDLEIDPKANGDSYHKNFDQIKNLISDLKNNPDSRRLIVSAWNVSDLEKMTLPPCHYGFQCYTQEMDIEERTKKWCDSIKKHISFGEDMDHERLDQIGFPKRKLSLKWTQRSCDVPLGIPYNIVSYATLLHLLSREVNMLPDDLIFSGGDCHIYLNQIDGIKKQMEQETYKLPKIEIYKKDNSLSTSIFDITQDDVKLINYTSSSTIKMPLSN